MTVSVQRLHSDKLTINGFSLTSKVFSPNHAHLTVAFDELSVPYLGFTTTKFAIDCAELLWTDQQFACHQGHVKGFNSRQQPYSATLSWLSEPRLLDVQLNKLNPKTVMFGLTLTQQDSYWAFKAKLARFNVSLLSPLMPNSLEITGGTVSGSGYGQGDAKGLSTLTVQLNTSDVKAQTRDGLYAVEKLNSQFNASAQRKQAVWDLQYQSRIKQGAMYAAPLFLETGKQPVTLTASGHWSEATRQLLVSNSHYCHGKALSARASGTLSMQPSWQVQSLNVSLHSLDLSILSSLYITPQLTETNVDGLNLTGRANASLTIKHNQLSHMNAALNNINFYLPKQDVSVLGIHGHIAWDLAQKQFSSLRWQHIALKQFPLGAASLKLASVNRHIELIHAVQIPTLGGYIALNQLHLNTDATEPTLAFSAELQQLQLNKLASNFNWTPLSGYINGDIPNVHYHQDTLTLGGDIDIDAFDGHIAISHLKAAHFFGNLPTVNADIALTQLDLAQLTQHFQFGSISGRLSGYVKQLALENWQPVSFFAWLGTPEHDDSEHKISQKAINNIAQIGGGATDMISRSILNVFDTFNYEQLGMGCYLHNGVCQLMGVEATEQGYFLIKGGGLPRVDVIGYNHRVDWAVLLNRLSRISSTRDVRIE